MVHALLFLLILVLVWLGPPPPLLTLHPSHVAENRIGSEGCIALSSSLVHLSDLKGLNLRGKCFWCRLFLSWRCFWVLSLCLLYSVGNGSCAAVSFDFDFGFICLFLLLGCCKFFEYLFETEFCHRRFDLCCLHHQHISAIAATAMIFVALHPWNISFDFVSCWLAHSLHHYATTAPRACFFVW